MQAIGTQSTRAIGRSRLRLHGIGPRWCDPRWRLFGRFVFDVLVLLHNSYVL